MNWEPGQPLNRSGRWCLLTTLETIREQCRMADDCWEWCGACTGDGEPSMFFRGKSCTVSRAVYLLATGKTPRGDCFLIRACGNRQCVNPAHLVQRGKGKHMRELGATSYGGAVRAAKIAATMQAKCSPLTRDQALEIRHSTTPVRKLAEEYGCSPRTVQLIKQNKRWVDFSSPFAQLMRM